MLQDKTASVARRWNFTSQNALKSLGLDTGRQTRSVESRVQGIWTYYCEESEGGVSHAVISGCSEVPEHLVVPETIGGLCVRGIAPKAFERASRLVSVTLPDSVAWVGSRAFAACPNLTTMCFSDSVTELDSTVLSGSKSLVELHLPKALSAVPSRLLADCPLEEIVIPAAVREVARDAFNSTTLRRIEVSSDNPYLRSDGVALFDKVSKTLLAGIVSVDKYEIPDWCTGIGPSAFKGQSKLTSVSFGAGVYHIDEFAFFRTSLVELSFPASLRTVGNKAFSLCRALERVTFANGVISIGEQAFSKTALSEVRLPASLETLGSRAFEGTGIDFRDAASFQLDPSSLTLVLDDGVLYRRMATGLELVSPLVAEPRCVVAAGTVRIADNAFEGNRSLCEVVFSEGLLEIGVRSFYGCEKLTCAKLPESLVSLGDEAFAKTALKSVYIGAAVERVGKLALETITDMWDSGKRSLADLKVSPDNSKYYVADHLLVERGDEGDRTLLFVGPADSVHIPPAVSEISELTFCNARLKELWVPSSVKRVAHRAFSGIDGLERVHVQFSEPIDGIGSLTVPCPGKSRDSWDFSRVLTICEDGRFFDFGAYDELVVHEHDSARVVEMALWRLSHPVKLTDSARANYLSTLAHLLGAAVQAYVRSERLDLLEMLEEAGYLKGEILENACKLAEEEQISSASEFLNQLMEEE